MTGFAFISASHEKNLFFCSHDLFSNFYDSLMFFFNCFFGFFRVDFFPDVSVFVSSSPTSTNAPIGPHIFADRNLHFDRFRGRIFDRIDSVFVVVCFFFVIEMAFAFRYRTVPLYFAIAAAAAVVQSVESPWQCPRNATRDRIRFSCQSIPIRFRLALPCSFPGPSWNTSSSLDPVLSLPYSHPI